MNPVKVSVCMITYNHETFIRQAIEGVLMQKTDFPIELVIGEDCSTDKTRQICQEYATNNLNINLLPSGSNLGMMANFIRSLQACSGKYIALCEGDDYWTDPNKLQKQVDFLEANPDFIICFHKVKILKEEQLVDDFITIVPSEVTTINDLANGNYIYPLAIVFRNILQNGLPDWFLKCGLGDYPLFMLIAKHGKLKQVNEFMGIYRINDAGVWYSKNWTFKHKEWHKMLVYLSDEMENGIKEKLHKQIIYYYSFLDNEYTQLEAKLSLQESKYEKLANLFFIRIGKKLLNASRAIKNVISKKG